MVTLLYYFKIIISLILKMSLVALKLSCFNLISNVISVVFSIKVNIIGLSNMANKELCLPTSRISKNNRRSRHVFHVKFLIFFHLKLGFIFNIPNRRHWSLISMNFQLLKQIFIRINFLIIRFGVVHATVIFKIK